MYIKISKDVERQYRKEVEQIINNKDFQKLRYYKQHNWSDRLMHSHQCFVSILADGKASWM